MTGIEGCLGADGERRGAVCELWERRRLWVKHGSGEAEQRTTKLMIGGGVVEAIGQAEQR